MTAPSAHSGSEARPPHLNSPIARLTGGRGYGHGPLRLPDFRKLLAIRLAGQFGDGVFQASLAGAVLFNPERAAHAGDVAAGFAVVLLPYSVVGPFVGVLIDRWFRQRILMIANVLRAVCTLVVATEVAAGLQGGGFYATALVSVSLNRFVLSSLSASLPHTVGPPDIAGANALSTTSGAIAATLGGAAAIGLRSLVDPSGGNVGYGVIAAFAAVPYLAAAAAALRFPAPGLGPDDVERTERETFGAVLRGLRAGGRHIRDRRPVALALIAIGGQRFCYGISVVCTLLLYRNYFHDEGFLRAGLPGLGQVVVVIAIGGALAAAITPVVTRRTGLVRFPCALLVLAAAAQLGFGLQFSKLAIILAAFVLGFVSQSIKISVDTTVQRGIEDSFRGRVFSLYDTLFNITFVSAATLTALVLPDNGRTVPGVLAVGAGYLVVGLWYVTRRGSAVGVSTESDSAVCALTPLVAAPVPPTA